MHRAWRTTGSRWTGIAIGQALAQRPQSTHVAPSRARRPTDAAEKGFMTAASGQSHRQKGTVRKKAASRIPPRTTYAQKVMSSPWREIMA